MRALKKSIAMRSMVALHYLGMVALFAGCWWQFYRFPAMQGAFSTDTLAVCTLYAAILLLLSRIYAAYKVGLIRAGELFYGQTLANLVSLGMPYILACALARRLLNPMAGFGVALAQAAYSAVWTLSANRLYFSLHRAKRTVVIYRNENDLSKLEEIRFFADRWKVERMVQWEEQNPHDLPQQQESAQNMNGESIYRLMRIMEDYEAVFVSGVNATLRNGIVKYCVEKDKDCYFVPHTGDVIISGAEHIRSFSVPICRARRSKPTPEYWFVKRAMDIALSLLAIIVASPFMAVTALAIRGYDHGPALYRQVRLTKDGRRFEILNLRWMQVVHELHKIQATIQTIICRRYTEFSLSSDFRHSIAGFAGVFAA